MMTSVVMSSCGGEGIIIPKPIPKKSKMIVGAWLSNDNEFRVFKGATSSCEGELISIKGVHRDDLGVIRIEMDGTLALMPGRRSEIVLTITRGDTGDGSGKTETRRYYQSNERAIPFQNGIAIMMNGVNHDHDVTGTQGSTSNSDPILRPIREEKIYIFFQPKSQGEGEEEETISSIRDFIRFKEEGGTVVIE